MKTQTEISQAVVVFDVLGKTVYKPRIQLFKKDSVFLNGNWSNDSIIKYCTNLAKKKGFNGVQIQLTVIREIDQFEEISFKIP